MIHSDNIVAFFDEHFNEKNSAALARKHKFIQRSTSKLKGHEFIKALIVPSEGLSTDSLKGLCQRIEAINPEANLSSQALCERINDPSSGELMKGVFAELTKRICNILTESCPSLAVGLKGFNKILIQDSTLAVLNEKLEKKHKGTRRGNNGVKSQIKIDLIHDLRKGLLVDASIFPGNVPDQSLSERIIKFIEPNDLIIRDLGYYSIQVFQQIQKENAYFLSRQKAGVTFYLNVNDKEPLDVGKLLREKAYRNKNIIELKGYLGKERVPIRLIIYRQTEEVTNQRKRVANKQSRKKGETLSKSKKLLLEFSMFVTNAPAEKLSAEMVGTIYRLRWEIELIFKRWKSQLKIDYLKGINEDRIDCLIWSRLCTVAIIELVIGYVKSLSRKLNYRECSEVKIIQYLLRTAEFFSAVVHNELENFLRKLKKDIPRMLLKDSRSSKTMRGRVFHMEGYYGAQVAEVQYVA